MTPPYSFEELLPRFCPNFTEYKNLKIPITFFLEIVILFCFSLFFLKNGQFLFFLFLKKNSEIRQSKGNDHTDDTLKSILLSATQQTNNKKPCQAEEVKKQKLTHCSTGCTHKQLPMASLLGTSSTAILASRSLSSTGSKPSIPSLTLTPGKLLNYQTKTHFIFWGPTFSD